MKKNRYKKSKKFQKIKNYQKNQKISENHVADSPENPWMNFCVVNKNICLNYISVENDN